MRKWKIRTKMIAGLCGLAIVIGLLVYNSWSQISRDQHMPTEIGNLADEIRYSHQLNHWAETLAGAQTQIQDIEGEHPNLHEMDSMIGFPRMGLMNLRTTAVNDIETSLDGLQSTLEIYPKQIAKHRATERTATALIDRDQQDKSLKEITECFEQTKIAWEKSTDFNQSEGSVGVNRSQLKLLAENLKDFTNAHFTAIQSGMGKFSERAEAAHEAKRARFWIYTSLSAFLIVFLFWQFWTLIVTPFQTLFRGSQLIANGHHQHKILLGTDDEIGSMADTVNDITDRFNRAVSNVTVAKQRAEQEVRDRTREVIRNEQLASVGFLAAGVAHEINNPLGAIAWSAEALEETLNEISEDERERFDQDFLSELQTNLALIQSEAFRCKGITKRLLHFSRLSDSTREAEDLGELVNRVVSMVGKVGEYRCKTIQTHADPGITAYCNAQEIQQVVLNLVSNALESVDTDGKVDVHVKSEIDPLSGTKQAVVIVQDDGCGMDQEVMDHLFEPFFTRRRDDTGTGLGLSISYRIVSLHHGSLTPHSDGEGCGSKMVLRLPAEAAQNKSFIGGSDADAESVPGSSTKWEDVQKVA